MREYSMTANAENRSRLLNYLSFALLALTLTIGVIIRLRLLSVPLERDGSGT